MKKIIITQPIFTPSTSTIDTKIDNFDVRKLYAIINQTDGILIYATATEGKGYVSVSDSTIVLQYNTSLMSSTDVLQMIYDDDSETEWLQNIYEAVDLLGFLSGLRGPAANLRVTVTDGTITIGSGTISNISAIGGFSSNQEIPAMTNIAAIQSNINNIQVNIS